MSEDHKDKNIALYDANAQRLAQSYNSVETCHSLPALTELIGKYTGAGHDGLDLGCGSGRDAHFLCRHDWNVLGVDGSAKMVDEARHTYNHEKLTFSCDIAPTFQTIKDSNKRFDLILMSAFIFHFDESERQIILENTKILLKQEGLIHITLRHGPMPESRTIFDVSSNEIGLFSQKENFSFHIHGHCPDFLGRDDISWTHLSLWRGESWNIARNIVLAN